MNERLADNQMQRPCCGAVIAKPDENPWHTGTPTEEGWYLCWVSFTREIAPMVYKWKNNKFMLTDMWESDDDILMWQKIEPFKETNND